MAWRLRGQAQGAPALGVCLPYPGVAMISATRPLSQASPAFASATVGSRPSALSAIEAAGTQVSISAKARAIDEQAIAEAVWQDKPPAPLLPGEELPQIPQWMGSYEETLRRSETALKVAMRQLGIPTDTPMSLDANRPDGRVTVEGDFPGRSELENLINHHPDLRNVLVATVSNAILARICAEMEKATAAAQACPANAGRYNLWLIDVVRQVEHMDFRLQYADGRLDAEIRMPDGRRIGILDALATPPA